MSAPKPGTMVVLRELPPGLLDGLPAEDQRAIRAIVGQPVLLSAYDADGRAELEFSDPFYTQTEHSTLTHTIYVAPGFIDPHLV